RGRETTGVAVNDSTARTGGGLVIGLLALTQFLMTLDASVMNVSISALVEDLDTSVTAIQGVITAYTLVMAAGMITGGKLGDLLGRRRALRIGLVVYACGSGLTALAPDVVVLLLGWSVLEGLGAALIMPTVTALIAGNFTGRARAGAYSTIAAAAAVAVALGPIIGGFVTAYYSWRWVFAAEVVIAAGILLASRVIRDVPTDERPRLDLLGALLSAVGLGLVVLGVLQSGSWGWVRPRVAEGPDATPSLLGISAVTWLVVGGLLLLLAFVAWQRHRAGRGASPLVDPSLFGNRQLTTGLSVLLMQYLVMMGMFFAMPLFLSLCLGLDAFDTGVRMLPLSLALVVTAPAVPKLLPRASPRRVAQAGLLLMLAASLLLAARLEDGADASITTLPFLLMGAGMGAMASQLGNVIVSSAPVERGSEVGGLQYTAQNLGSSLGTALVGAVVISALATFTIEGIQASPSLAEPTKQSVTAALGSGVEFVSDADVEAALTASGLPPAEREEIGDVYAVARLDALRNGMVALSIFVLLGLFLGARLPERPLVDEAAGPVPGAEAAAPARGP
ncbi:MAG TPA: MFS transporter, partial [Miltoncostaeaceae bacterium]|nr:MFS transporter [Miltoncostaeaceae bacterium]